MKQISENANQLNRLNQGDLGAPESKSQGQNGTVPEASNGTALEAPIGLTLESVAEQCGDVKRNIRGAATAFQAVVDVAEEMIRRDPIHADSELEVASCLSRLAQLLQVRKKKAADVAIKWRARKLVARELNTMDGLGD